MTAVTGQSTDPNIPGVLGITNSSVGIDDTLRPQGDGVFGNGDHNGRRVVGVSHTHTGVEGNSTSGAGVWGQSESGEGIHAETKSPVLAAIAGFQRASDTTPPEAPVTGAAIYGKREGQQGYAGYFDGNLAVVTGALTVQGEDIGEAINSLGEVINGLVGRVDTLEGEVATLRSELATLSGQVASLEAH